jgi:hypothetical protein
MPGNLYNPPKAGTTGGASGAITTQTDVTGSRAMDGTVYHNATSKPIFCVVTGSMGIGASYYVCSDSQVTPTLLIAKVGLITTSTYGVVSFWVLPGNYYQIGALAGSVGTNAWIEYT